MLAGVHQCFDIRTCIPLTIQIGSTTLVSKRLLLLVAKLWEFTSVQYSPPISGKHHIRQRPLRCVPKGKPTCRAKTQLLAQVAAAEAELAGLHTAHTEAEEAIWKRKKKGEQEVDMAVREYDTEIAERHAEVQQEEAALQGLQARMQVRCLAALSYMHAPTITVLYTCTGVSLSESAHRF